MCCIPCTLLDHDTHDPLLSIPKQSLLPAIGTFWYRVQLLVPVGLFAHAIPYMILAYCFWHFYACLLPLVSQGNWVSFYSTLLILPFGYSPGFIWLRLLVPQLGHSFLMIDLEDTAAVLPCQKLICSVPMCGNSYSLLLFLSSPNIGWCSQSCIESIQSLPVLFLQVFGCTGLYPLFLVKQYCFTHHQNLC